jgi:hypothetical protein
MARIAAVLGDREMDFESLRGYAPFDELLRPKG